LAIDYNTGDLLVSSARDIDQRTSVGTIEQRIWVNLRVIEGQWALNPSLGSRIHDLLRMPVEVAMTEAPLVVREALDKMPDIRVTRVDTGPNKDDTSTIDIRIYYVLTDDEGEEPMVFDTTLGGE
jgi:hypothetical protein